jgi:antitoxin PrlF
MNLARVSSKGEITIPAELRKKLKLKDGDKVIITEQDEKIVIENASLQALREIQEVMSEEAKKQDLTEDDILKLCKETRQELWEEKYAHLD